MTRLWLWAAALLVVALMLLVRAVPRLGLADPTHAAIRGFSEGCAGQMAPCWYGIVPRITPLRAATDRLRAGGAAVSQRLGSTYVEFAPTAALGCGGSFENVDVVPALFWHACPGLRVGDLLALGLADARYAGRFEIANRRAGLDRGGALFAPVLSFRYLDAR